MRESVLIILERVNTRVVVVVVVVVAQPDCLSTLVRMSQVVTEPKSHNSLPKHLPVHTRKSHLRRLIQRQTLQFSLYRHHWSSRCYARKTDRKGKDAIGGSSVVTSVSCTATVHNFDFG